MQLRNHYMLLYSVFNPLFPCAALCYFCFLLPSCNMSYKKNTQAKIIIWICHKNLFHQTIEHFQSFLLIVATLSYNDIRIVPCFFQKCGKLKTLLFNIVPSNRLAFKWSGFIPQMLNCCSLSPCNCFEL